jgi:hypothetical protein
MRKVSSRLWEQRRSSPPMTPVSTELALASNSASSLASPSFGKTGALRTQPRHKNKADATEATTARQRANKCAQALRCRDKRRPLPTRHNGVPPATPGTPSGVDGTLDASRHPPQRGSPLNTAAATRSRPRARKFLDTAAACPPSDSSNVCMLWVILFARSHAVLQGLHLYMCASCSNTSDSVQLNSRPCVCATQVRRHVWCT